MSGMGLGPSFGCCPQSDRALSEEDEEISPFLIQTVVAVRSAPDRSAARGVGLLPARPVDKWLAGRAPGRGAAGQAAGADRRSAPKAWKPAASVDLVVLLRIAGRSVRRAMVAERAAATAHRSTEDVPDGGRQGDHVVLAQAGASHARIDARAVQRLVGVDVADTGDRTLVKEGRLHASPARERQAKPRGIDVEGIGTERVIP